MADRNEAAPPFHPRPRVPPGSRQHTLTGGNVIFRGKTSFSGVNGKLPLSSEKSWDSWWNFRIWSFFFFIIQDNTVERDVRFSKYLKFVISEISISKSALCRRCVWKRKKGEILIYFFNWKGYDYSWWRFKRTFKLHVLINRALRKERIKFSNRATFSSSMTTKGWKARG